MVIITNMLEGAANAHILTPARVVLVTGAAGGIGRATCRAFASEGARVAALDRDPKKLREATSALQAEGLDVTPLVADVSASNEVEEVVAEVERALGSIDVAVSVAGILKTAPLIEITDQDWQATLGTNLSGVFHLFRSVAGRMLERRRGNLIAVGSNAATTARVGMSAYAASKAGLLSMVRCLGLELAYAGIRCNVVSPGSTDTAMQRAFWEDGRGEREVLAGDPKAYRLGIPLQRLATPEDVASAVRFLASDQARHITLHDLRVDGGATLDA
jgi:2,3-dihydro-2,3-dihydroxybenzoate dehydrogenase